MTCNQYRRQLCAALAAAGLATAAPAMAQATWPDRPIRILIGYQAGGGTDIVARLLAPKLSEALKVPVVVENRPGAAGMIAEGALANAPKDGYTLLMDPIGIVMNPSTYKKVTYDPIKDIQPVAQIFSQPFVIVVNAALPVSDLKGLAELARRDPKAVNVAVAGTSTRLAAELFALRAGLKMTMVPYKGSAPASAAVAGGEVQVMFADLPSVRQLLDAGKLRALAVMGRQPVKLLPNVRPAADSGVFDDDVSSWTGMFAPGGTPPAVVATLNTALVKILSTPEIVAQLEKIGVEPATKSVQEFTTFYREELRRWQEVVERANIQPAD